MPVTPNISVDSERKCWDLPIDEAIELPSKRFALGVLWHPEEDEHSRVIGALVAEARRRMGS